MTQVLSRSTDGLCECGCGGIAPISPTTNRRQGYQKGKPRRFIHGHHRHYPARVLLPTSHTDRAWAAGVFDGEGTVYIAPRRGTTHSLIVSVGQSTKRHDEPAAMLLKLRGHYGGSLSRQHRPSGLPHHTWQLSCRSAELFLRSIAPYVVQKAEQVSIALEYREKIGSVTHSESQRYLHLLRSAKR